MQVRSSFLLTLFPFFLIFFDFLLLSSVTSCQSPFYWTEEGERKKNQSLTSKKDKAKKLHFLTQSEAEKRAQILSQVQYQIFLKLEEANSFYSGVSELEFHWAKNKNFLRVDFFEAEMESLVVNSKTLIKSPPKKLETSLSQNQDKEKTKKVSLESKKSQEQKKNKLYWYDKRALFLSPTLLVPGKNHIKIQYKKSYSSRSQGLMRFKDEKDQKVYLATQFQPYAANELFPCFDQPDLKATYTLRVEVPKDWKVISAMREYKIENLNSKKHLWHFPKSFLFSTYLFSLHAGPYRMWKSQTSSGLSLRLYARQSVAKYVHPKIWFNFTRRGLKFFPEYFSYPYPYSKYDQVIHPLKGSSAMENVGAVLFGETFLFRSPPSFQNQFQLAYVIFHEMAHMWFGNLVTLKWWDDLWLNESFATYMGYLAIEKTLKDHFPFSPWTPLSLWRNWVYFKDELESTTHPVMSSKTHTTAESFSIFDVITYGKGGILLRQMVDFLGEENFRKSMKEYFHLFHEKNATWKDLFNILSQSNSSLFDWSQKWLNSTGFNSIEADFECKEDKISEFSLKQKVEAGTPILRPHQLEVSLLKLDKKKKTLLPMKILEVKIDKKHLSLLQLKGNPCPDLVYPNWNGLSYVQVHLNPKSLKNAIENMSLISLYPFKLFLLKTIWKSFEKGELSLKSYSALFLDLLKKEKNLILLKSQSSHWSALDYYYPKDSSEEKKVYWNFVSQLEEILWNRMKKNQSKEERLFWKNFFIKVSRSPKALNQLSELLNGQTKIKDLFFRESHERWPIITKLSEFQYKNIGQIAEKEKAKDASFKGKLGFLATKVLNPNEKNKQIWLEKVLDEKSSLNYQEKGILLSSLYPPSQKHLHLKYKNFFRDLLKVNDSQKNPSLDLLPFFKVAPSFCNKSTKQKVDRFIKRKGKHLNKKYKVQLHFLRKKIATCLRVRKMSF